jgi:hypothetical protein
MERGRARGDLTDPYSYTSPPDALSSLGCVMVFATMPLIGVLREVYVEAGVNALLAALGVVAGLMLALYVMLSTVVTIEVDRRGLRITKQRRVFGFTGAVVTLHDVRFDAVTKARELRAHSPAKNGGWNVRHELQFAEHGRIESTTIPGDPTDGPFREMVRRVEAHVGDRFSLHEDFGPMTAAVQRQVADALEKKGSARAEEPR